jgi:hypothetical protein
MKSSCLTKYIFVSWNLFYKFQGTSSIILEITVSDLIQYWLVPILV